PAAADRPGIPVLGGLSPLIRRRSRGASWAAGGDRVASAIVELDRAGCLALLRTTSVGRLVFSEQAMPVAHPVNFALIGDRLVFRTSSAYKRELALRNDVVGFQADRFDPDGRAGWSVMVIGRAELVTDIDTLTAMLDPSTRPWIPGPHEHVIQVTT